MRASRLLAAGLWALFVLVAAATVALAVTGSGRIDQALIVLLVGFATVGALVAARQPGNAVGWLLLATALGFAFSSFADAYVGRAGHPGELVVAWFGRWAWFVWFYAAVVFLPLVFPNGRLLSRRWRVVVWMAAAAVTLNVIYSGLKPGPLEVESAEPIPNPLGLSGVAAEVVSAVGIVAAGLTLTSLVLGAVSLVLRLRQSWGRERQQVKWFVYVGALALSSMAIAAGASLAGPEPPAWVNALGAIGWLSGLFLIILGIPLVVGLAILRHRLYDIDVVINRTLVYGSLTVGLAACYFGLVLLFRLVLSPITGQSNLAIAGSTLAVAALFRPARGRIQVAVDRAFYRTRYDAERTMNVFTARLRSEVTLEAVGADLQTAVRDTVQPAHISLWLPADRLQPVRTRM